jgi:hypothetical protein
VALYEGLRQQPDKSRSRAAHASAATDAQPENRLVSQDHQRRARVLPNIRRGHDELGVDEPMTLRVAASDELVLAI